MKVKQISLDDALAVSKRYEDYFFDRKSLDVSGRGIQKIAVAFANSDGGEFVVGIADDSDEPVPENGWKGATKPEDFNSHLQALFEVQPTLDLRYEYLICDGKPGFVLHVLVEKSSEVHKTSDNNVIRE